MDNPEEFQRQIKRAQRLAYLSLTLLTFITVLSLFLVYDPTFSLFKSNPQNTTYEIAELDEDRIENGIHVRTGLVDAEGLMTDVNNRTNCHSAKLVTQNRMSEERWNSTIKWMQETQNLWDLGKNQEIIVNYLVTNYPVKNKGRRENLSNIEWYELEN